MIQKTLKRRGCGTYPHTYAQNVIHVVFSTKDRRKIIQPQFQPAMWGCVAGICKKHGIFVLAIGGSDDHIHLLIQIPSALSLAKAVLAIKSNSSRWAKDQGNEFAWQEGCAAFSVSSSNVSAVIRYIGNQGSAGGPYIGAVASDSHPSPFRPRRKI